MVVDCVEKPPKKSHRNFRREEIFRDCKTEYRGEKDIEWTKEETQFLKKNWINLTYDELAEKLDMPKRKIYSKVISLGLKKFYMKTFISHALKLDRDGSIKEIVSIQDPDWPFSRKVGLIRLFLKWDYKYNLCCQAVENEIKNMLEVFQNETN